MLQETGLKSNISFLKFFSPYGTFHFKPFSWSIGAFFLSLYYNHFYSLTLIFFGLKIRIIITIKPYHKKREKGTIVIFYNMATHERIKS